MAIIISNVEWEVTLPINLNPGPKDMSINFLILVLYVTTKPIISLYDPIKMSPHETKSSFDVTILDDTYKNEI